MCILFDHVHNADGKQTGRGKTPLTHTVVIRWKSNLVDGKCQGTFYNKNVLLLLLLLWCCVIKRFIYFWDRLLSRIYANPDSKLYTGPILAISLCPFFFLPSTQLVPFLSTWFFRIFLQIGQQSQGKMPSPSRVFFSVRKAIFLCG